MSEPIQAISQGNYILHNIDAKKLYVQEPLFTANSGDAVYVGIAPSAQYNETMLYSGSESVSSHSLSDNASNYQRIRIAYDDAYNNCSTRYIELSTNLLTYSGGNLDRILLETPFMLNHRRYCRAGQYAFISENTFEWQYGYQCNSKAFTTANALIDSSGYDSTIWNKQCSVCVRSIIGINRKENA